MVVVQWYIVVVSATLEMFKVGCVRCLWKCRPAVSQLVLHLSVVNIDGTSEG